ncbi:MAG: anthranilate synthase component I family protein [Ferruginibacter sp.]|nr:anthranilate synthase component I family protein [Ferruginibacter sp.]
MLNWANQFNIFCLLDNQQYNIHQPSFECLLAAGKKTNIEAPAGNAFELLQQFYNKHKHEWLFGHFCYDLKNEIEGLHSHHEDKIGFCDLHFFVPEIIIELKNNEAAIYADQKAAEIFKAIISGPTVITGNIKNNVTVTPKIKKSDYLHIIEKLKQHILRGDCYEINFCQEFYASNTTIDPLFIYNQLTAVSPNPFSAFYKFNYRYCLCASPERYLQKNKGRIFSQPIKGTAKRDLSDKVNDDKAKNYLLLSEKEKSENVMVVDLVRNDLSRICKPGTVQVDELFGLYSFPQVHQMISTISGVPEDGLNWIDCIKATFPMGSMTGAPKKRVMELIEEFEQTRRGLFSGALGYVKPNGDFDFNVVIRSMLYNEKEKNISFQTGGGITFNSNAVMEYEECLLKAEAMMKVL